MSDKVSDIENETKVKAADNKDKTASHDKAVMTKAKAKAEVEDENPVQEMGDEIDSDIIWTACEHSGGVMVEGHYKAWSQSVTVADPSDTKKARIIMVEAMKKIAGVLKDVRHGGA